MIIIKFMSHFKMKSYQIVPVSKEKIIINFIKVMIIVETYLLVIIKTIIVMIIITPSSVN